MSNSQYGISFLGPRGVCLRGHAHWHVLPRHASRPSLMTIGTIASAAAGSAQAILKKEFTNSPARAIHASHAQAALCTASAASAALPVSCASILFWLASHGMTAAAASNKPMPSQLGCGVSNFPVKESPDTDTMNAANMNRRIEVVLAALCSL